MKIDKNDLYSRNSSIVKILDEIDNDAIQLYRQAERMEDLSKSIVQHIQNDYIVDTEQAKLLIKAARQFPNKPIYLIMREMIG